MNKPHPRDRINDIIYISFIQSVLIGVIGGFQNSELIVSIGFFVMMAVVVAYVARRLALRRRRSRAAHNNLA